MNGLSHPYQLDEPTFMFMDVTSKFSFLFHFSMKFMKANRIAPDGTSRFAASHLGLFYLHMSHKNDAMLIWVILWLLNAKTNIVPRASFICLSVLHANGLMSLVVK